VRFQLNGSRPFSSLLEAICHLSEADQREENVAAGRNPKPSDVWTELAAGETQGKVFNGTTAHGNCIAPRGQIDGRPSVP
jgi:hypothetical protein